MLGALWRTAGQWSAATAATPTSRTLPVVDPELDALANQAHTRRRGSSGPHWPHIYLDEWNNETMIGFDQLAKMSQFAPCGGVSPADTWSTCSTWNTRQQPADGDSRSRTTIAGNERRSGATLHRSWAWCIGRSCRNCCRELFDNPTPSDAVTYAEVHLFIPRQRLVWQQITRLAAVPGRRRWAACRGSLSICRRWAA